jgi:replicative DNA helicase
MSKKFVGGERFEEHLVMVMLQDKSFAQQMVEILKPKYFTQKHLERITKAVFDWYEKHTQFPPSSLLGGQLIGECQDPPLKIQLERFFKTALEPIEEEDSKYTKETALEFCRKNHLLQAIDDCLDMAESARYEQVVATINEAVAAGSERNFGHIYKDALVDRMRESARKPVATPWKVLNDIIGQGLSAGELGVILALTGVGKSHALVDLGAEAASAGLNVVHFTFELSEIRVGKRYDARLTGIDYDALGSHGDAVAEYLQQLKGSVRIKKYPNRYASVMTLRNYVSRLQADGIIPDLLIVDYADIMQSGKRYENKRFEEETVYEELRSLADELGIPIWTASQTNRSGMDVEVLTLKHIAECFAKANIADLFITMNRKKTGDYEALISGNYETLGNMYIAKSRLGPDGVKFNCLVNTALSKIRCLEPGSPEEEHIMAQHDLNLETDAQRIRKQIIAIRAKHDNKTPTVRLVPPPKGELNEYQG